MIRKHFFLGAVVLCSLLGSQAMAVEEPGYKTILQDGNFEVRDYAPVIVAEVTVSGDQKEAANQGFRLLAAYIFGGNTRRQGIAMTAPVSQEPAAEKIAMTAPVTQTRSAGNWTVRFTMPSAYTLESLPEPNDPRVHLRRLQPARIAVLRFSGLARESTVNEKSVALRAAVKANHLSAVGRVTLAQYNPPWTPWFMRRNEVMIALEPRRQD